MMASELKPQILVVTVVHHPEDARIRHRQIEALLDAGWSVTYAAPFTGFGVDQTRHENLNTRDLPRSHGRHRLKALMAARRLIRREARRHDLVLVHDPELLFTLIGSGVRNVVWDVHEDTAAALETKKWLPSILRKPAQFAVRSMERWAERNYTLLLAEYEYQDRFRRSHAVVPNSVRPVPVLKPLANDRVIYLGSVTEERGAAALVAVAKQLKEKTGGECSLHVIGPANDAYSEELLTEASASGDLVWHGFLPQDRALPMLDGALAGISLLQNVPNYRHSMPTKVLEYMAHGLPVLTTDLPLPGRLVTGSGSGVVVPFGGVDQAVAALMLFFKDTDQAADLGARGYAIIAEHYNWNINSQEFIRDLEGAVTRTSYS